MKDSDLSFWLDEALAGESVAVARLQGRHDADICIVGGGFTGLWTAIEIKRREPARRVAIVERGLCGSGASGRNGGFLLSLWAKFLTLEKLCGTQEALRLAQESSNAIGGLRAFCDEHGIDAGLRLDGWLWAATSPAQIGTWTQTAGRLDRLGAHPFQAWSADEVARRCGSSRHLAGVFEPVAATLQPAKLARGLKRAAQAMGVEVFEQSPMRRLGRGATLRVHCSGGVVRAGKVVLAMNAWAAAFAAIRRAIVVVSSDIVATRPVPDVLQHIGWTNGMAISDCRMLVHYYRTTADGRIVFGKGGGGGRFAYGGNVGSTFDGPSPIAERVADELRRTYPALGPSACAVSWSGPIDRSKDGLPLFGHLDGHPDILYGVGYSGNGVGPSMIGGRILASLALRASDEWSGCGLVRPPTRAFPPEPFRYLGGKLVRAAVARQDAADDAGRPAGAIVKALARLAPAGLSPVKETPTP